MDIDPRIVSYSILAVVVGGGVWGIRRMIARFATQAEQPKTSPLQAALQAGDKETAARLALDAGEWDQAAELLLSLGRHAEAARAFRSAKNWDKAGDLFQHVRDFGSAAQCYRRSGNVARLLQALIAAEDWPAAAETAEQAGELARAADLWLKAGNSQRAVALLHKTGQVVRAATLDAELAEQSLDWVRAAENWRLAQDLSRALTAYEKAGDGRGVARTLAGLGRLEPAADRFVAAGAHAEAAPLYEGLGAYRKAAMSYQRAGNTERAIHCLTLEGDKLAVVKLRLATGQGDEALRVALTAENTEPSFVELSKISAEIQTSKGDLAGAGRTLASLMRAPLPDEERVVIGRQAIDALVSAGDTARARTVIEAMRLLVEPGSDIDVWLSQVESRLGPSHVTAEIPIKARTSQPTPIGLKRDIAALSSESTESIEETAELLGSGPEVEPGWPSGVPKSLASRYGSLSRVGQGGNGIVFRATDKLLGRAVVLKFMLEGTMPSDMTRKYFLREVQLAAALNHPNIVHIYDMGEADHVPWYCMEFVDGKPLTGHMNHGVPIADRRWVVSVLEQLCDALDYAHSQGMVHRDIKPDNVLVSTDNKVKLLDFGLARILNEGFGENSVLAGTPYYMAPEQLDGSPVDHRADIYALGVIVFRIFTGYLPYVEGNVFVAHAVEPIPDPCKFNPLLPLEATRIVAKAMAKKPADRYDKCLPLARDVRQALGL